MATSPASPLWEVVSQVPEYGINNEGKFGPGIKISFRTRSGAQGFVYVPHDDYTVEHASEMIAERATAMEAVHNLKG